MQGPGSIASAQFGTLRMQAVQLLGSLERASTSVQSPVGPVLLDLGIRELVPWGWKGTSRRVASSLRRSGAIQETAAAHRQVDALVAEARGLASQHSTVEPRLTATGNSARLVRRFGQSLDTGSPVARLQRLVRILDSVERLPLVANREIPDVIARRRYARTRLAAADREPELRTLLEGLTGPQRTEYYVERLRPLEGIPAVAAPVRGAIGRLSQGGPDAYREGVEALRLAFDELVRHLTGSSDWKRGLIVLLPDEMERKVALATHHLFSRAAHVHAHTSQEDLQMSLDLFATLAIRLVRLGEGAPPGNA